MPRPESHHSDFRPQPMDYEIELSADGQAFRPVAAGTRYVPEEHGWRYHSFGPQPAKAVRIRIWGKEEYAKRFGHRWPYSVGLAGLRLYEAPDAGPQRSRRPSLP